MATPDSGARARSSELIVAALLLALVALAARGVTFDNPVLGFDEQFYLLVGDRMLHGAIPYVDIFDRKPIGLFLIFAFARLLGGDGFVQYRIVAFCCVVATAVLLYRLARQTAPRFGAFAAAGFYILWLDVMEGEGGQAEVFVNFAMMIAATALFAAFRAPARLNWLAPAAMLAVGVALQIKYSALGEGVAFGCALWWLEWHRTKGVATLASVVAAGASLVGCALAPTALALAYYAAIGHTDEFLFANFISPFGQSRAPFMTELGGLAVMMAILMPLAFFAAKTNLEKGDGIDRIHRRLLIIWLIAATVAIVAFWRFDSPHYAIPILIPATLLLAPGFARNDRRRATIAIAAFILVGGQIVLGINRTLKGGPEAAAEVARAAEPGDGCIYVYDGYPALYMLTHSCLPTRWVFPGHLNTADEAHEAALGIDPAAEVRRIMATHPSAVIIDEPRFAFGNAVTWAIVTQKLMSDYRLTARVMTGTHRARLVYRIRRKFRSQSQK